MADQFGAPQGAYPPPPAGQPYGYPPPVTKAPGQAIAAAVLGYVHGGLVMVAAIALFAVRDLFSELGLDTGLVTVLALLNIVLGALFIFGGVRLNTGKDRNLLVIVSAVSLAYSIFWATQQAQWWAIVLFSVLPIVILAMALNANVTQWLASRRGM
jgi:hypothetical protein